MSNFWKGMLGGVGAFAFVALAFAGVSYWNGGVVNAASNPNAQKIEQTKKAGCGCANKNLADGTKKQGCSSGQCGAGNGTGKGTGCGCGGGNRENFVDANGNGVCDRAE